MRLKYKIFFKFIFLNVRQKKEKFVESFITLEKNKKTVTQPQTDSKTKLAELKYFKI